MNDGRAMELIGELRRVVALASNDAPYCVLSRRQVEAVLALLAEAPLADPWLVKAEKTLTPTEFRLYRALYLARGVTVDKRDLLHGAGIEKAETLWVHVRRLRCKALEMALGKIETVRERGYFLEVVAD
jgi:DNA-binding response OmpR family regulator